MATVLSATVGEANVIDEQDDRRVIYGDAIITLEKSKKICEALYLDPDKTYSIAIELFPDAPARILINY